MKQQQGGYQLAASPVSAWRYKLGKHRPKLMKYLECQYGLLDYLYSQAVLTMEEHEAIQHTNHCTKKKEMLLEIMHRCSDVVKWNSFVQSLHQTTQSHLARLLEESADAGAVACGVLVVFNLLA